MATAGEDAKTQELNLIFKSLGEQGKEGEIWKKHAEYGSNKLNLLQKSPVFEGLKQQISSENCIVLPRLYGSSIENLKSLAPDDLGDLDYMITPQSEDLLIDDRLIEYLPEHPLHVRINGSNHPVLQSCLVKDTSYIATSAVKNFHPAIYGSITPHMINLLTNFLETASRENWFHFFDVEWENKEACPALQVKYAFLSSPVSRLLERRNTFRIPNYDPADFEWLYVLLFLVNGLEYTKELAERFDEIIKSINDLKMPWQQGILVCLPVLAGFLAELMFSERLKQIFEQLLDIQRKEKRKQEMISSKRSKQFIAKLQDVMSRYPRSESETGSGDCLAKAEGHSGEQSVTQGNCDGNETGSEKGKVLQENLPTSNGSLLTPENALDGKKTTEDLGLTLSQLTTGQLLELSHKEPEHAMSKEVNEMGLKEERERKKNEGLDDSDSESDIEQPLAEKGELIYPDLFTFESLSRGVNFFCEHLLSPVNKERKAPRKETDAKDTDNLAPIAAGLDLVPALRCSGWPQVARGWIKRERKWPSPDVIDKVVQEGFHLVVKPPKKGGNPEYVFRISFSHAECLLSQEMNEVQRECYRCLKKFYRGYLKDPKGLVTFHLKNLLLHTIEETGAEIWTESNRVKCVMKLFENLLQALTKKELPHFFVRSYNLFGVDHVDDPEILEVLASKVEKIVENPMQSAKQLIQKVALESQAQLEKEKNILSSRPTPQTASEQGYGTEREETPRIDSQMGSTFPVEKGAACPVSNLRPSYRFHDLRDAYLAISQEFTYLAFNVDDQAVEALESSERALVGDIREIIAKHNERVPNKNAFFQTYDFLTIFR